MVWPDMVKFAGRQCPTNVLKNTGTFVVKVSGAPLKGCVNEIDWA